MELRQIRYALAVAEELHFTRAAERMNVAQSALSSQIKDLERELGADLFERTSRSVRLTTAGDVFVARARAVLAGAQRLVTDVQATTGQMAGFLAIGVITTANPADLPGLLREYSARYPNVGLRLKPQPSSLTIEQVASGELDMGIIGLTSGILPRAVISRALWTESLVAVVCQGHPWAVRKRIRLEELESVPMIDFPAGTDARAQSDAAFRSAALARRIVAEADSAELIADLVRGGVGVGLLPESYAAASGLHALPLVNGPTRTVHVISNPKSHSAAVQALLDILTERLAVG